MKGPGKGVIAALLNRLSAMSPWAIRRNTQAVERLNASTMALRTELRDMRERLHQLSAHAADSQRHTQQLLEIYRRDLGERARFAALPHAKLRSDALVLQGRPALRMRVERRSVGQPFERPFSSWLGVTRCASSAPDIRALWERLLACEAGSGDVLRSLPSTVLDMPGAVVSRDATGMLRVSLRPQREGTTGMCAVPRFAYTFPARKLRNFGHWLLDCVPQVVAMSAVAPDAVFLLPAPLRGFHRSTLSLVGLAPRQMVEWDGAPVECGQLLVQESDGRMGGGRPLAALAEMRRLLARQEGTSNSRGRRIYVSRRDARNKRRWLSNEPAVEAVFRSRGFEILAMADHSLEEQVRIFRDARIVAGISGAGLADIVFSPPATHVVVLLSDSLIRWYADQVGQRSAWVEPEKATRGGLAALGDSPRFYVHLAAAFDQYCHCFLGGDEMPLDPLSGFLDDVLRQVDHA